MTLCRIHAALDLTANTVGRVAASMAVAGTPEHETWTLPATVDEPTVLTFPHATRVHRFDLRPGPARIEYTAEIAGGDVGDVAVTDLEVIEYTRPSRYCPSDELFGYATGRFGTGPDAERVRAVVDDVASRLFYVPGSSRATDTAINTLLGSQGMCRDYAHLCIALCRALDIPARYVAVYAPGLKPMDFHAVAEIAVDGVWRVFDATRLAPRQTMVRIATGRDAADTAFLTTMRGDVEFSSVRVTVTSDGDLPVDDHSGVAARA